MIYSVRTRARRLHVGEEFKTIHTGREGKVIGSPRPDGSVSVVIEPHRHVPSGAIEDLTLHGDVLVLTQGGAR